MVPGSSHDGASGMFSSSSVNLAADETHVERIRPFWVEARKRADLDTKPQVSHGGDLERTSSRHLVGLPHLPRCKSLPGKSWPKSYVLPSFTSRNAFPSGVGTRLTCVALEVLGTLQACPAFPRQQTRPCLATTFKSIYQINTPFLNLAARSCLV